MDRTVDPALEAALNSLLSGVRVIEDALYGDLGAWTIAFEGEMQFPCTVNPVEMGVEFRGQAASGTDKEAGTPIVLHYRGEPRAVLPLDEDLEARTALDLGWAFVLPERFFVG